MKSAWFIMKLWRQGDIDTYYTGKMKEQPSNGFKSFREAELRLSQLFEQDKLSPVWNEWTIMKLYFF